MSDFDDEPIEGSRSTTDGDDEPTAPTARPRRRPRREDDDVWDDEPAAAAPRSKRARPADDEWDDEAPARPARGRTRPADDDGDDWDDDWDDDRGGGKRDLTLVFAIAAAVLVIALVVVLTRPKDDKDDSAQTGTTTPSGQTQPADAPPNKNWQGPVGDAVGEVEARVAAEDGVFIWTGFDGWHVRNKSGQEITVVITAEKVVQKQGDEPAVEGDAKTELTLTLPSNDGTTGADLDLFGSTSASISVKQGETPVAADQIKLGGGSGVAPGNPVELTKA